MSDEKYDYLCKKSLADQVIYENISCLPYVLRDGCVSICEELSIEPNNYRHGRYHGWNVNGNCGLSTGFLFTIIYDFSESWVLQKLKKYGMMKPEKSAMPNRHITMKFVRYKNFNNDANVIKLSSFYSFLHTFYSKHIGRFISRFRTPFVINLRQENQT
jgi:hypothetical protein